MQVLIQLSVDDILDFALVAMMSVGTSLGYGMWGCDIMVLLINSS